MKITEFIDRLSEKLNLTRKQAHTLYQGFAATLADAMSRGEDVRIEGLGRFHSKAVPASQGRPQTGGLSADNLVIEVYFSQFATSRRELAAQSPYVEEVAHAIQSKARRVDRGSTDVGTQSDRNEPAAARAQKAGAQTPNGVQ